MSCPRPLFRRLTALFAAGLVCVVWLAAGAPYAHGQARSAELFPEPFLIEHYVVQVDTDGSSYRGANVTDYYGGSWIVSVAGDASRMIVDLERRTLAEVRPRKGP